MYLIGLRYCGGCNPQINRSAIIKNLKKKLEKMEIEADFTTDRQASVDIIILINGCIHACLEEECLKKGDNPQYISIKGGMVDDQYVEEDHIPEFLSKKIVDLLNYS